MINWWPVWAEHSYSSTPVPQARRSKLIAFPVWGCTCSTRPVKKISRVQLQIQESLGGASGFSNCLTSSHRSWNRRRRDLAAVQSRDPFSRTSFHYDQPVEGGMDIAVLDDVIWKSPLARWWPSSAPAAQTETTLFHLVSRFLRSNGGRGETPMVL